MDLGDDDPPQRRKPICNMSIYLDKYGWLMLVDSFLPMKFSDKV